MKNRRVILGISGGIAAYKAPYIIRLLKQKGASVQVVCTRNALEFVTVPVLETLSENPVYIDVFPKDRQYSTEHISITDNADLMIVAPATGNIIGKFASGIADDDEADEARACARVRAPEAVCLALAASMSPIAPETVAHSRNVPSCPAQNPETR